MVVVPLAPLPPACAARSSPGPTAAPRLQQKAPSNHLFCVSNTADGEYDATAHKTLLGASGAASRNTAAAGLAAQGLMTT